MNCVILSGVHGVGKGFFLNKIRDNIFNYNIYTASELIEQYKSSTDAGYKKVSNIYNNQELLVKAIDEVKGNHSETFILDGHLCLFNAINEVERIPEKYIKRMNVVGIILLQDNPVVISERINQRDGQHIDISDIEQMQVQEKQYAEELNESLHIGYEIITHDCSCREFEDIMKKNWR